MRNLACGVALVAFATLYANAQLVLYDDFNTSFIDPDKWVVNQTGNDASREYVKEIQSNALRTKIRVYGDTTSDNGGRFDGAFLAFPDSLFDKITTMQTTVRVTTAQATSCANNPDGGTQVQLYGSFFNVSTPTPGSWLDDVRTDIDVSRFASDAGNTLHIQGKAVQCNAVDCSGGTQLGFVDMGTVNIGDMVTLTIKWDQAHKRFRFIRTVAGVTTTANIVYSVSDTASSGARLKGFFVSGFPPNCIAPPRPIGYLQAFFDNVFVNP